MGEMRQGEAEMDRRIIEIKTHPRCQFEAGFVKPVIEFLESQVASAAEKARMAERERIAKIVESEPELDGEPDYFTRAAMISAGPVENSRAAVRATKKSIISAIRSPEQGKGEA